MDLLKVAGVALWIISLSIQAGASRAAFRRVPPDVRMPLTFGPRPLRARRAVALCLLPVATFLIGAMLLTSNRDVAPWSDQAWVLLGVRATGAALLGLAHLRWLAAALAELEREGALRP